MLFILCTTSVFAQIEKPPDSIVYADQYLKAGEYEHAFNIYAKNKSKLNSKQQFHFAELFLTISAYNVDKTRKAFKWYKKICRGWL